ncbi:MAG: lamin tail domain-containing protein [Candidatus Thermoplasmatota archaeon]|nr:lamin tail domain-containing protein [Candidatus Thermoplasmatota archaeon]
MKRKKQVIDAVLILCILGSQMLQVSNQPLRAEPSSTLLINEVMYHPSENENTNEWIELYNPTSESLDVVGWMIADEKETDTLEGDTQYGDGSTIIAPGGYAVITDKETTIDESFTIADTAVRLLVDDSTLCGYGLNNQQEYLILYDAEGTVIDAIEWGEDYDEVPGSPVTAVDEGHTLARYGETDTDDSAFDFFDGVTPTPGSVNIDETVDESSTLDEEEASGCSAAQVLITELYYHTYPKIKNEFAALYNPTTDPMDVSGWYLTDEPWSEPDDQAKIIFPDHTLLPPQTTWVLTANATAYLWETTMLPQYEYAVDSLPVIPQLLTDRTVTYSNTGGLVGLYTASSTLVDLVIYGEADHYISCWEGPSIPSSGQGVILKRNCINGTPLDTNSASDWMHHRIYRIGQSAFPLEAISARCEVTAFVSPDNSYETITQELRNAHSRIDINLYEFTNPFLYNELLNALHRGITLRMFMEGSPIGGLDEREQYILQTLAEHGAWVRFIVSDADHQVHARYQFNHAKYLIIDNTTVIVESCNWAKTGVPKDPSFGNREWGIVVRNQDVASLFQHVFDDDWNPQHPDSYPIEAMNLSIPSEFTLNEETPTGTYTPCFQPKTITDSCIITPVFSPDTSEQALLDTIDAATSTIYIQQLYIYKDWADTLSPLVEHLINKSLQGVTVRVLLDYNLEYDDTIIKLHETQQLLESYGVAVVFISSDWSPFSTVHNKGMIIDNHTVLISSINWNEQSVRKNREAGLLLHNEDIASYYASVFCHDWTLATQNPKTSDVSWADYKYYVLVAIVFCLTFVFILRDWRKRKWR